MARARLFEFELGGGIRVGTSLDEGLLRFWRISAAYLDLERQREVERRVPSGFGGNLRVALASCVRW